MQDKSHLSHDNMEHRLQLEIWRGNVAGALQIARQENELSDWLVAMAPLASRDTWEVVSSEYAEQLEEDGQYHKAVTYLLAANKVHQAIDLLRKHRLYKEAVSLTKLRLSPLDPMLEDLYTEWGQHLMKDGQFEEAAKCYLAMRHIQEVGKAYVWNHDQLCLKSPFHLTCHTSGKQNELTSVYQKLSHHLVNGRWQEAYKFAAEQECSKILLPLLTTHETLIQQLSALNLSLTLTHSPLSPEMFSQWEKKDISKNTPGLPEFLVDKSEIDPVIPWEPFLIGDHAFPHHLLRVWHHHLNVTMITQELRGMYTAISQLGCQKGNMDDIPNALVVVSMDITLCLLALLMAETSTAVTHFLKAIYSLHQTHQKLLLQALCRLMLPQGPKYLLKLQQEFNASRVLITMESYGDVNKAGGENNTIKKFLTDIKDDNAITMSSLRCRELDCLRAYYYLAVLDFLQDKLQKAPHENDSHDGMPSGVVNEEDQNTTEYPSFAENVTKHKRYNESTKRAAKVHHSSLASRNIQDYTTSRKASVLHQNNTVTLCDNSSLLQQSNGPVHVNSNDVCPKMTDIQKSDCSITCADRTGTPITPLPRDLKHLLGLQSSQFPYSVPTLPEAAAESSSVDPLFVPSKLPLLKFPPLRREANGNNLSNVKSSLFLPSSISWSSYSPFFMSPSSPSYLSPQSNSPTSLSPPDSLSASPSTLSWPLNRTISLSPRSASPSSASPATSPLKTASNSSKKTRECVGKINKCSEQQKPEPAISQGLLNYTNLLRLSKGILWDVQAKKEALTKTLGYIHLAISQHLLQQSSHSCYHCDSVSLDTSATIQTTTSKASSVLQNSDLEEDGGFRNPLLPTMSSKSEGHHRDPINISSKTEQESSKTVSSTLSKTEPGMFLKQQSSVKRGNGLTKNLTQNTLANNAVYMPSSQQPWMDYPLELRVEQDLLSPICDDPLTFHKCRKVLWVDGKETCASVAMDSRKSGFQISGLPYENGTVPVEWDDLSVDVKYSMPYITLELLKQEQENFTEELKRVSSISEIPFPSTKTSVKSLLFTCLMSPHLSAEEKHSYIKQLNDWATLFAVTSEERHETEAMFKTAVAEAQ